MPLIAWDEVRAALDWLLEQPGAPTQEQLAAEADLNPSTISTFRADWAREVGRGMQRRTWNKLAPVLNRHLPPDRKILVNPAGASGSTGLQSNERTFSTGTIVPIIDARRFPVDLEGPEMLRRIRASAQLWRNCSTDDPDAFGIFTTEPLWGDFWAMDALIFSPATEPIDGEYIYARVGSRPVVCKWLQAGEDSLPFVRVPSGREYTDFKRLGTLVDQWRSHLNRRPAALRPVRPSPNLG